MSDDKVSGISIDPAAMLEAQKYLKDRDWRINNLYYIVDYQQKFVKFSPNRVQKHFDKNKHTKNIIGKSRQHGFTTWETIDCLDEALFGQNQNIMIIAHRKNDASEIFQTKVKRAWEAMAPLIKQGVNITASTAEYMEFENGNGSKSKLAVGTSGIGMTLSRAHITELSYLDVHEPERADNVIRGVMAAAKFGRVDIESTGRSDKGHFYNYFMNAKDETPNNPSEFKRFFYNWQWDDTKLNAVTPEFIKEVNGGEGDQWEKFREYKEQHDLSDREIAAYYGFWLEYNKDWDLLHSEYPTTIEEMFSSGEDRLFSGDSLDNQIAVSPKKDGRWQYFHEYDPSNKYSIGVDVAEGIGRDSSAIVVLDVTNNKVAATYCHDRIAPDQLAYEILKGARRYGDCLVAVERNNHGHTTLSKLREVYNHKSIYKQLRKEKLRTQRTFKFGWETNSATKPKMFYELSAVVNSLDVELSDAGLILEARMYTKGSVRVTKPKDGETAHFDKLTALTIAWQVRLDAMALENTQVKIDPDMTAKLRELQKNQFML